MKQIRHWLIVSMSIGLCVFSTIALNQTTASVPLVELPDDPLYLNGSKSKANLTLALSVEAPTVGTTFWGAFSPVQTYMGYFDPMYCYINQSDTSAGEYFVAAQKKDTIDSGCDTDATFDGNFLNWATSSAIDILRYGLTGGNRVVDEGTGEGTTVLERAYLPDYFYGHVFFPTKQLPQSEISKRTPFDGNGLTNGLYIRNCRNRVYFATENDGLGGCSNPFGAAGATSRKLLKHNVTGNSTPRFHTTRVKVCDSLTAANRLMTYNESAKSWSGLCLRYTDGQGNAFYKPVGQFQVNADNVRVSVFSYLNDDAATRYGGVMRSPLKYLGPRHFDTHFNVISGANPNAEWDAVTGVLRANPQLNHADYGDQSYGQSGAINYINRFGTLDPNQLGKYKSYDPVGELYYEAFRYLQGKTPTGAALDGLTGNRVADRTLSENFPVYTEWKDPFAGFQDNPGQGRSCARNSMLAIADPFTHNDRGLPGNTVARHGDTTRGVDQDPDLNVEFWTSIVGSFEANLGQTYRGSDGKEHKALSIQANDPFRPDLKNIATDDFSVTGATGSYLMAGLAYFANTQSFRTDLPKARINTFAIDVNAYNLSVSQPASVRRGFQLHLAAKYGGFDDARGTGNPFEGNSNIAWQGGDGDARNYFLADSPQKFLDSISQVFSSMVDETSSIAGVAATEELRLDNQSAVFQGTFNPVANYWSGRLRKLPLTDSKNAQAAGAVASSWEAGELLTARTSLDHGADRLIVVGPPVGRQGEQAPTALTWQELATEHKAALNTNIAGVADELGEKRLAFLRGDRRDEETKTNPTAVFRSRDMVLGTIVNAGLVFQAAPSRSLTGTGYANFQNEHKSREAVVFAAANDGMLHAFRSSDGTELFAYMPGFVVPRLHTLPDKNYAHRPVLDATPTAGEAFVNGAWRSVLVGGAGAGAQGIYAIDVTDPAMFGPGKVLWEFTDADHAALGNVTGRPHIARVRVNDAGTGTNEYKWVAIVPGGVNNQRPDGHAKDDAAPSIFLLDLAARPSAANPWREGSNFWRIELAQTSNTMATGLNELTTIKLTSEGTLAAIYAGDLQGNVWKLDFSNEGLSSLGGDALANLKTVNAMGTNTDPLFVAKSSDGVRQPITSAPVLATGVNGSRLVIVGTGKYLEVQDTSVPVQPGNSLYVLPDGQTPIQNRSALSAATIDTSNKSISTGNFKLTGTNGWYLDFRGSLGERQVSSPQLSRGMLSVDTLFPTGGACGEGSGFHYDINLLTGTGSYWESDVGLLGGSFRVESADTKLSPSLSTGRRAATYTNSTALQGSKGIGTPSTPVTTTVQVGRMSWREVQRNSP